MTTSSTHPELTTADIAGALDEVRSRTLAMLATVPDGELVVQHSPLMSPLAWDLAHVGNYEDQWLIGALAGAAARVGAHLDDLYDAFRHPRKDRPSLPILPPEEARRYIADVRARTLEILGATAADGTDPLTAGGFVYGMVIQHEHQHDETMLATLQLRTAPYPIPAASRPEQQRATPSNTEVLVPAGPFVMGTDTDPWAYDNERPAHTVTLDAFWIDAAPVTNSAYADFIADGGYDRAGLWSTAGWAWRQEAGLVAPQFWFRDGEGWGRRRFGTTEPVPADEPVQHVCWYEADAFARWAGKRLPTEAEWEKAASWGPGAVKRSLPWGDAAPSDQANLWGAAPRFAPAVVGSYPGGASAYGCVHMIGDVWEWTSSDFLAYPGFRSFPYREYSEVFFPALGSAGDYKVLRGGSWATHPAAVRTTFRNWDHPIRRQIFSGFRCARDADEQGR
jgi:iron(II)-dependent oxidoreductase